MEKLTYKQAVKLIKNDINLITPFDINSLDFKPQNKHQKQLHIRNIINENVSVKINSIDTLNNIEKTLNNNNIKGIYYIDSDNELCLYNLIDYIKTYKKVCI